MLTTLLGDSSIVNIGVTEALYEASHKGHVNIIKWLFKEFPGRISTIAEPLRFAVMDDQLDVVELLLANKTFKITDIKSAFEYCHCPLILDHLLRVPYTGAFKIRRKTKAMRAILWQERQARLGHVNRHHLAAIAEFGLSDLATTNIYSFLAAPRNPLYQAAHVAAVYAAC